MWFFFLVFLFLIMTHYLLFPLAVSVLSLLEKPHRKEPITPSVSLIIAAYNESRVIESKLQNSLELDYPKEKLEIIVVCDGSRDDTPQIVEKWADRGVINLFHLQRRGKTHALNRAVESAHGDILVFSDANNMYDPQAIKNLVRNFSDETVGGVSGRKCILDKSQRESTKGDSAYWSMESELKRRESLLGSIPTGDGEIFAVRKALYTPLPPEIINDDMALTINIVDQDYRVIYEPEATSTEAASITLEDDFRVKARMVAGGYQIFSAYRRALWPISFFSLQLFLHKGLRYLMPFLLVGLYLSSLSLQLQGPFYFFFAWGQTIFYGMALVGAILRQAGKNPGVCYFPLYYCVMNAAAALGMYYFLKKRTVTTVWAKAAR